MSIPPVIDISDEVMKDLEKISVATACGTLLALGFRNTFMIGISPMSPGQKLLGRARTVRYLPVREDITHLEPGERVKLADFQALETLRPGEVMVCDVGFLNGGTASTVGDVMISRLKFQGGVGVVVDGALRDIGILRTMGVPVFLKQTHAVPGPNAIWPWDLNVPVQAGGVLVMPGDVIIGDDDGVVVIPQAVAAEVASKGLEEEAMEKFVREYLAEGGSIGDYYPPSDKTRKAMLEAAKGK
jgi:5-oxopent-3-ene-1,2,5-tricarboxylate decarboxylase/2-hydroxyhepta-2,4-diene-1,7-dioate isomerase